MKRIFSIILAVMMLLSVSLVASADGFVGMKSVAVESDTDITVTVSVYGVDTLKGFTATFANTDKLTYVADSAVAHSDIAGFENALKATVKSDNSAVKFTSSTAQTANYITKDVVTLFTYKVEKASADVELSAADFAYGTGLYKALITAASVGSYTSNLNSDKAAAIFAFEYVDERTPAPEPDPEPEEEEFEITKTEAAVAGTDTMKDENGADVAAAGDKVVAIFAKNISDAELAAGSYGIVFGGVRYAGQLAVPAKTAWAIKLVGSAEQLPAGSYAYGVFAGDATVDAATPWVID